MYRRAPCSPWSRYPTGEEGLKELRRPGTFVSGGLKLRKQPRKIRNPLEEILGSAGDQVLPSEGPPQRGDRRHPRRVPGVHVVHRVAHEHRVRRVVAQAIERHEHGFRVRLVSFAAVAADDQVEMRTEPDMVDSAPSEPHGLAGDDADGMPGGANEIDGLQDGVVAAHQSVVVLQLVLAVLRYQRVDLGRIPRVPLKHGYERNSHTGEPLRVVWDISVASLKRMPRRRENQLDRVHQGAIEVEEHGEGSRNAL